MTSKALSRAQTMSITKVLTKRDLEEAYIDIEAATVCYMLKDLLLEAEKQGRKVDINILRFSVREDKFLTDSRMYRIEAKAR